MNNKEVIERLKKGDWYVECKTEQDANLVLQACNEAGITWRDGDKATEYIPYDYPVDIGFCNEDNRITLATKYYKESENENITDWFFDAIKNNDGNLIPKLTPQNAEQEHLVQILLAMMQKIPVEVNISGEWELSVILFPTMNYEYRIKPTLIATPLPISREIWSHLHKRWRYATMDRDGQTFWHQEKPTKNHLGWGSVDYRSTYPLNFNSEGINWETSLTERPEGV